MDFMGSLFLVTAGGFIRLNFKTDFRINCSQLFRVQAGFIK